jgi:GDP-D-mannose 3', 5'-epimerase
VNNRFLYIETWIRLTHKSGPIAQSVEQRTFNPWVDSSSLSGPTNISAWKCLAKIDERKMMSRILVAGAGGFIGGWLVRELISQGHEVVAVDVKPRNSWYQVHEKASNHSRDLSLLSECQISARGVDEIYNLAADMGGMGFIENNKAACMLSVLINTHLLMAAKDNNVKKFFFASSACVYNASKQDRTDIDGLKEEDAYPAMPEDGYGWEKLFSERMCRHFYEDFGIETRIARYHNVYGPHGTWDGGREKAPAALSRKVALASISKSHEIEIWGDGEQTRSFTYISDCIEGTLRLMESNYREPLNVGSDQMVSINQMADILAEIAGISLAKEFNLSAPKGVRGRNSDNTKIKEALGWAPNVTLEKGLRETYFWILNEINNQSKSLRE